MEPWIAEAVGKMHIYKIRRRELAAVLEVTPEYLSMILNEKRCPKMGKERVLDAIDQLIRNRTAE
ncbi:MAG: hypothetical protein IJC46_00750 [Clostridia bacterium]|nr:hypothetical protein [Clostridia bacterium]